MSRIAIVGSGYVGLCTAVALATKGHRVTCLDVDEAKVEKIARGKAPFHEKGLDRELASLTKRRQLLSSMQVSEVVRDADLIFLCVGTPSLEDGSLDPSQVLSASSSVADGLRPNRHQTVVVKSTVIPGTTESVIIPALEEKSGLHAGDFGICVNPEFLTQGNALAESVRPTRIVVGEHDHASGNALLRAYTSFRCPKVRRSLRTAEAIKYATNAFLATKVTFANELANLCSRLRIDADDVLGAMALDPRINPLHLRPGPGFGGSCLPKDLRALVRLSRDSGYEPALLASVLTVNDRQHLEVVRMLEEEVGPVNGKRIALLGLAFKEGTDDVRESKALAIASDLTARGARVIGYDPLAGSNFARASKGIEIANSVADALEKADGCVLHVAWPEFARLKAKDFVRMTAPVVIDARRTWPPGKVPKGIRYRRIG